MSQGLNIYLNQDYTSEVQKKWKLVRDVIKKLQEKNVKAQASYSAQVKLFLESGMETFNMLTDTVPVLKEMRIHIQEDKTVKLQKA